MPTRGQTWPGNTIAIEGADSGVDPILTFDFYGLAVIASTPTLIVAALPGGTLPGSYLLTVSPGPDYKAQARFELADVSGDGIPGPPDRRGQPIQWGRWDRRGRRVRCVPSSPHG